MMSVGMFWNTNHPPSIQLEELLSEEDITLQKLMDADDVIQECKSQNKKLVEYLVRPEVLEELVNLITSEPSMDIEERWRYKYSNIACELLTCDVPVIIEKLAGSESLLSKLYAFLNSEEPLNALLASFFSKTLHALFRRATDQNWYSHQFVCLQVLDYLKSKDNFVNLLLQHLDTSAIMDLLIIFLSKIDDDDLRSNILTWLDEHELVQKLVCTLSASYDSDKHENVSQLLCDIIDASRRENEKKPDPIMVTLQSEHVASLLLDTILKNEKVSSSSITNGIKLLLNMLGDKEIKPMDSNETYGVNNYMNAVDDDQRNKIALICVPHLDELVRLLGDPPQKPPVRTTMGLLEKPFGITRLYILKLICSLLSTELPEVRRKCIDLNVFQIMLDLFFQYSWNNFLHSQVQQCLALAITCDCPETRDIMYQNIFLDSKLLSRIYEAWEQHDRNMVDKENGIRDGYIGHLIVIANHIVTQCEENSALSKYLTETISRDIYDKWYQFTSVELEEVNKLQQISLGEPAETYMSSSGVSDEYTFNDDPPATSAYPDSQDYNDNSFLSRDYSKREALFNSILNEKMFDGVSSNNQWEYDYSTQNNSNWLNGERRNSDSSDEEEKEEDNMFPKIDSGDPWDTDFKSITCNEIINIWNSQTTHPVEQTGWADFDSVFSSPPKNDSSENTEEQPDAQEKDANETLELNDTVPASDSFIIEKIDEFLEETKQNVDQVEEFVKKSEETSEITEKVTFLENLNLSIETSELSASEKTENSNEHNETLEKDLNKPIEEASNGTYQEPTNQILQKASNHSIEETSKQTSQEPSDENFEDPIEEVFTETVEEVLKQTIEEVSNRHQTIEEAFETTIKKDLNEGLSIAKEVKFLEISDQESEISESEEEVATNIVEEVIKIAEQRVNEPLENEVDENLETLNIIGKKVNEVAKILSRISKDSNRVPFEPSPDLNEDSDFFEDFGCETKESEGPQNFEIEYEKMMEMEDSSQVEEAEDKTGEISETNNAYPEDDGTEQSIDNNDSYETCPENDDQENIPEIAEDGCETFSEEVNSVVCEVCPVESVNEVCPVIKENAKIDPNANDTFKMATEKTECKNSTENIARDLTITDDHKFSQNIDGIVDKMSNLFAVECQDHHPQAEPQ